MVRTAASTDRWVVAVGDISACSETSDEVAAGLVGTMSAATLLTLGDNAYPDGSTDDFASCYVPSWGASKGRTRPVPGNHDYRTRDAAGYFSYFGAAAGDPAKGYYSYDLGLWHMVALNSNCTEAGGCGPGSPQEQWLRADLWAHRGHACTLAYMHHPRFSSGDHGPQGEVDALWRALYAARADIVLSGHDHAYERFAPQTPDGTQVSYGIRQFVVGTGGASLRSFRSIEPNSVYRQSTAFGALRLYLGARGYSWTFLNTGGGAMDSAPRLRDPLTTIVCHPRFPVTHGRWAARHGSPAAYLTVRGGRWPRCSGAPPAHRAPCRPPHSGEGGTDTLVCRSAGLPRQPTRLRSRRPSRRSARRSPRRRWSR